MNDRSTQEFARARRVLAGGVNSPVRAFKSVGGTPVFMTRGEGCWLDDVDGRRYVDHVLSWGPMIIGHAHPEVIEAVTGRARAGSSFGTPTVEETVLAEKIIAAMPAIEKIRFVNSGTEATMSAIRLARAATGRDLIVKFAGGYHGHADSLLSEAGSGVATLGIPGTPGVTKATAADTLTVPYNDLTTVRELMRTVGDRVAAIIVEPVAGNMGVVPPATGFLAGLRAITRESRALLIFDEVITGFRVALGGAEQLYGVAPDLACLGKIIGGGYPVGAYGGPARLMDQLAPDGPVYQAGTLSGNPVAMAAGAATIGVLERPGTYASLETTASRLADGLMSACVAAGVEATINRVGSMMTMFFGGQVTDYATAKATRTDRHRTWFHAMLKQGIYCAPSPFEAMFVSTAHTPEAIEKTLAAHREAMAKIR